MPSLLEHLDQMQQDPGEGDDDYDCDDDDPCEGVGGDDDDDDDDYYDHVHHFQKDNTFAPWSAK